MKIGDDMENKERQDFESVFTAENGWDLTCINGCYQNIGTFKAFAGWKAAKDHAIPEGFVLVPRKATKKMIERGYEAHDCFFTLSSVRNVWDAMIEAQEQSHD